ncbi:MAG: hypothetical protein Aurels2KO_32240 [Aureliella sp.]
MQFDFSFGRSVAMFALLCTLPTTVGCGPESGSPEVAEAELGAPVAAQKATAGVGKQGQKLKDEPDIIAGPVKVLFKFKQQAVLDIQIPQALQLFKASNGRMPKSHDEFMQQIVEANRLQLPELPDGAVYRFNTEKGELWVYPAEEAPSE